MLDVFLGGAVALFAFLLYLIISDAHRSGRDAPQGPTVKEGFDPETLGSCECPDCYRRRNDWPHDYDPRI